MNNVLGVATGHREAGGAVQLLGVAVVEADGVLAPQAVLAAHTATVRLGGDLVANLQPVHRRSEGDDRARPFVPGNELPKRRLHREGMGDELGVGAADGAGGDFDKNLAGAGGGYRPFHHLQVARAEQDRRAHGLGDLPLGTIRLHPNLLLGSSAVRDGARGVYALRLSLLARYCR